MHCSFNAETSQDGKKNIVMENRIHRGREGGGENITEAEIHAIHRTECSRTAQIKEDFDQLSMKPGDDVGACSLQLKGYRMENSRMLRERNWEEEQALLRGQIPCPLLVSREGTA